jgi:hypothetical protein
MGYRKALATPHSRTMLVFEDPGGEPLDPLLRRPMELKQFLRYAIGLAAALGCRNMNLKD